MRCPECLIGLKAYIHPEKGLTHRPHARFPLYKVAKVKLAGNNPPFSPHPQDLLVALLKRCS